MQDRRLDRQVEALDEFLERWERFRVSLQKGFARAPLAPTDEADFLALKGGLAEDHEALLADLEMERDPGDQTLQVLAAASSLQRLGQMTEAEARALEAGWNASYVALKSVLGGLKARKLQLASMSGLGYYIRRVLASPAFILLLLGAVVAGTLWLWNFAQPSSDNIIERRGPRPTQTESVGKP
ncbi:MAG: hypothetical protein HZA91_12755 [Verrucomicrobia bacterium]|nr:hypothetical protein [Verrucomicrobiota bacterium]